MLLHHTLEMLKRRSGLEPARQFAADQPFQHGHACLAIVEAGQGGKVGATGGNEILAPPDRQFFQRFQAIGGKARRGPWPLQRR